MPTVRAAARHDLTDAQWALLEPLLPAPARRGRPHAWPLRGLIDSEPADHALGRSRGGFSTKIHLAC